MPQLAVVIVNWNTRDLTLDALRTLYVDLDANGPADTSVWVVDNGSNDDSVPAIQRQFPQVNLLTSDENLGFGGGNNLALRAMGFGHPTSHLSALPDAVYLLNSDTLTQDMATRTLFETLLELPDAGVVGARLTYGDGSFQHSAFALPGLAQLAIDLFPMLARFYESRINGRYPHALYQQSKPFSVGFVLGATMMLRREVIVETGMFDHNIFMYAEEVDWCMRIWKAGWKLYCVPRAHVVHLGGQSTRLVKARSIVDLWRSRVYLLRKHYTLLERMLGLLLIRIGMQAQIRQAQRLFEQAQISHDERDAMIRAYKEVAVL